LSIAQRATLLRDGLRDRQAEVQKACEDMVCDHWLVDGQIEKFLKLLDVETNLDIALLALKSIFKNSVEGGATKSAVAWNPTREEAMTSEGAVFWYAKFLSLLEQNDQDGMDDL